MSSARYIGKNSRVIKARDHAPLIRQQLDELRALILQRAQGSALVEGLDFHPALRHEPSEQRLPACQRQGPSVNYGAQESAKTLSSCREHAPLLEAQHILQNAVAERVHLLLRQDHVGGRRGQVCVI